MPDTDFFDKQNDLTAVKILIYQQYLKSYLPKVLMQYGKCFIADLFCGPGKSGASDGSPLVLLNVARNIMANPILRRKWQNPEVTIVFSDSDKSHTDNLGRILKQNDYPMGIKIVGPLCEDFNSILVKIGEAFKRIMAPKFVFLDPFTYSDVKIKDVKTLIDTPAAEVLLFLPTFHSYRFVKCADDVGALRLFLENFTDRGCANYRDISDFNESIRRKLRSDFGLKYVRAVGLEDGARKNALFYLTKHITGMLLMNNLVWKYTRDGVTVKAKRESDPALFDLSTLSVNFQRIKDVFQEYIRVEKRLSNVEIIDFIAQNCFTTRYVNDILKEMKKQGLVDVEYKTSDKIQGFYVADSHWNNELSIINYRR